MSDLLPPATVEEVQKVLEEHGDVKVRERNVRNGASEDHFGVKSGDIRAIAKSIKSNHELGLELWQSGNPDAMLLATYILKPKLLSEDEVERMAASVHYAHPAGELAYTQSTGSLAYTQVADALMTNIIRQMPGKEALRIRWMESSHPMLSRAGWSLTTERVIKNPDGLDLAGLLDRIERELEKAPNAAQWTMNYCLAEIGINFAEHRQRALEIGEALGVYRDFPVSKGCTSPFAPSWIGAMVAQGA